MVSSLRTRRYASRTFDLCGNSSFSSHRVLRDLSPETRDPRHEHASLDIYAANTVISDSLAMPSTLLRQLEIDLRQGLRRIFIGIGEMAS